jgi:hypothetical protein
MTTKKAEGPPTETYSIGLDGKWLLAEFSEFFHFYTEVYSLCFVLTYPLGPRNQLRDLLDRYPWRGGYSAVNFYDDLYHAMGKDYRPDVKSIRYSSPGELTLLVVLSVATNIRTIIEQLAKGGEAINNLYTAINKSLTERKLRNIDVRERELELSKKEMDFVLSSYSRLSESLHIPESSRFLEAAPHPLVALKVLLSLYRRAKRLAEFQAKGKSRL